MIFVLTHGGDVFRSAEWSTVWRWEYRQGSLKNPGDVLAVSNGWFPDEKQTRSDIAKARKAFGGARMAKVHSIEELSNA